MIIGIPTFSAHCFIAKSTGFGHFLFHATTGIEVAFPYVENESLKSIIRNSYRLCGAGPRARPQLKRSVT